jgi:bacterioferritin-associated ferredoxin
MTAKINLPDIDDKYRRSYSAVYKQHELRKELLIDQDCRECGRQVQQVMYEETEYS